MGIHTLLLHVMKDDTTLVSHSWTANSTGMCSAWLRNCVLCHIEHNEIMKTYHLKKSLFALFISSYQPHSILL